MVGGRLWLVQRKRESEFVTNWPLKWVLLRVFLGEGGGQNRKYATLCLSVERNFMRNAKHAWQIIVGGISAFMQASLNVWSGSTVTCGSTLRRVVLFIFFLDSIAHVFRVHYST